MLLLGLQQCYNNGEIFDSREDGTEYASRGLDVNVTRVHDDEMA